MGEVVDCKDREVVDEGNVDVIVTEKLDSEDSETSEVGAMRNDCCAACWADKDGGTSDVGEPVGI